MNVDSKPFTESGSGFFYVVAVIKTAVVLVFLISLSAGHSVALQSDGSQGLKTYTVDVPETSEWQNKSDSSQLLFGRTLSSPLSTLALSAGPSRFAPAQVGSLSELVAHIAEEANKETKMGGRYQLTKHSEKTSKRSDFECVEYQKVWVDHGGDSTNGQKMHMQAKGLVCVHPSPPYRLIEVSYSIRDHSEAVPEKALEEGEHFINSLRVDMLDQ